MDTTTTTTRAKVYVGKCKTCKAGYAVELAEVATKTVSIARNVQGFECERRRFSFAYPAVKGLGFMAEPMRFHSVIATCGHKVTLARVDGRVADHVCGAKCLTSTGHV